jgi:hypothetical protein
MTQGGRGRGLLRIQRSEVRILSSTLYAPIVRNRRGFAQLTRTPFLADFRNWDFCLQTSRFPAAIVESGFESMASLPPSPAGPSAEAVGLGERTNRSS